MLIRQGPNEFGGAHYVVRELHCGDFDVLEPGDTLEEYSGLRWVVNRCEQCGKVFVRGRLLTDPVCASCIAPVRRRRQRRVTQGEKA